MYGQVGYVPPPTSKSSGGGALKIVLIVLAVVVGLGVVAAAGVGFVAWRAMHALNSNGNSISMGKSADVSESDLGIGIYPGAVRKNVGGMKIKTATSLLVSATYTTNDPESAVLDFYRGKLGGDLTESQSGRGTTLTSSTVDGKVKDSLIVTVMPTTQVDAATTQFMILHTKTSKP
jgi:hypothetical protein